MIFYILDQIVTTEYTWIPVVIDAFLLGDVDCKISFWDFLAGVKLEVILRARTLYWRSAYNEQQNIFENLFC